MRRFLALVSGLLLAGRRPARRREHARRRPRRPLPPPDERPADHAQLPVRGRPPGWVETAVTTRGRTAGRTRPTTTRGSRTGLGRRRGRSLPGPQRVALHGRHGLDRLQPEHPRRSDRATPSYLRELPSAGQLTGCGSSATRPATTSATTATTPASASPSNASRRMRWSTTPSPGPTTTATLDTSWAR